MSVDDVLNTEFTLHPINKTMKYIQFLTALLFRTKDYSNVHFEVLIKSLRFFNF